MSFIDDFVMDTPDGESTWLKSFFPLNPPPFFFTPPPLPR